MTLSYCYQTLYSVDDGDDDDDGVLLHDDGIVPAWEAKQG
jgi:hypothetical protein